MALLAVALRWVSRGQAAGTGGRFFAEPLVAAVRAGGRGRDDALALLSTHGLQLVAVIALSTAGGLMVGGCAVLGQGYWRTLPAPEGE